MTFCYQTQCEDSCYSPCNYGSVYSYRTYDCESPCGYRGQYRYRDCYPCYSSRYCYPSTCCYTRRYSYGTCYPCYRC